MWSKTSERAADRLSGAAENAVSSAIERKRLQFETLRPRMFGGEQDCINPELRNNNALPPIYSQNRNFPMRRALAGRKYPASPSAVATRTRPLIPTGIFRSRSLTTDTIGN